jgi:hypothetical protein
MWRIGGQGRCVYTVLMARPEVKNPLGRSRHRWKDLLKSIFKKWNGSMDWINLAQDRNRWLAHVNAVINL